MLPDTTIPIPDAQARLRLPNELMHALLRSGLLGFSSDGKISTVAVEHFEKYGTQWRPDLPNRSLTASTLGVSIDGNVQPFSTVSQIQISANPDGLSLSERDTGWIAQFYFRPNQFFFSDPSSFALSGPIGLKLDQPRQVEGTRSPTYLYPDPTGSLAMAMVLGGEGSGPAQAAFNTAYDIVAPILDELAFTYDHPLPVAQTLLIGVPSGVITITLPKPSPPQPITIVTSRCEVDELVDATAMYREGISTNNPFHQFLTLWKAYENAIAVRSNWRLRVLGNRSDSRLDVVVIEEQFPKVFAFNGFENSTFGQAKERLRASHRNAVAHGTLEEGKPHSGATAKSYMDVATAVPILRYMAHATLKNVRASLASRS